MDERSLHLCTGPSGSGAGRAAGTGAEPANRPGGIPTAHRGRPGRPGPLRGYRGGQERALAGAVGLVALGSLVRGVPAAVPLVAGSLLAGFGIGVAGVLLTGVVKEHLAAHAGAVTGGYVVAMMIPSTVASAVAVPLAVGVGGWSIALAVWAVPAVLALGVWAPVVRGVDRPAVAPSVPLPWRDRFARLAP